MANDKQRKTFLSYSRANTDFAKKLAKELKAEGFYVWLDQLDIPLGARWDIEVENALEDCEIFMIILTPDSINSENVRDEIGYAIDTGKRFMPIMLEKCNIPLRLRRFQYVDFTTKSFEDGVESAKQLLRGLIEQDTSPRGNVPADDQEKIAQTNADQKAKKKAERIIKKKTDDELTAQVDIENKAQEETERLVNAIAEANRKVKEKATSVKAVPVEIKAEPVSIATNQKMPNSKRLVIGIVVIVVLVIAWVGISTFWHPCGPSTCSSDGAVISVVFVNKSDKSLDLISLDNNCRATYYDNLSAGESLNVNTNIGHAWLFADENGKQYRVIEIQFGGNVLIY